MCLSVCISSAKYTYTFSRPILKKCYLFLDVRAAIDELLNKIFNLFLANSAKRKILIHNVRNLLDDHQLQVDIKQQRGQCFEPLPHVEATCLQGLTDVERLLCPWLDGLATGDPEVMVTTARLLFI